MKKNYNKKTKFLICLVVAIIIILFAGIVYQFVYIKSLEAKLADANIQANLIHNLQIFHK